MKGRGEGEGGGDGEEGEGGEEKGRGWGGGGGVRTEEVILSFKGYAVPLPFSFVLANAFHHDNFSLNMH